METVSRKHVSKMSLEYRDMLKKEKHHDHEIIMDEHGTIRWKQDLDVRNIIDNHLDLNYLVVLFQCMGFDKNSEVYRKLYRDMGYSLSGYWEVFYWAMNNENAYEYKPTFCEKIKNKIIQS